MALLQRIEVLKDMVQEAIDRGATSVEEVHKAIAAVPFDMAKKNGILEDEAENAKEVTMESIGYIYDKIREVNRIVGELASDMFASLEDAKKVNNVIDTPEK